MSFYPECYGPGDEGGGIFNMYLELPEHFTREESGIAKLEIDAALQGIKEPPVAWVSHSSINKQVAKDYRGLYIEFAAEATATDIFAATNIAINSLRNYRQHMGPA